MVLAPVMALVWCLLCYGVSKWFDASLSVLCYLLCYGVSSANLAHVMVLACVKVLVVLWCFGVSCVMLLTCDGCRREGQSQAGAKAV